MQKLATLPQPDHRSFEPWYGRPKRPYAVNMDRVLEQVAPFGYTMTLDSGLKRWNIAGDRFAELNYLANTQDQELAPSWLEMLENGLQAESLDQGHPTADGDRVFFEPSDHHSLTAADPDTRRMRGDRFATFATYSILAAALVPGYAEAQSTEARVKALQDYLGPEADEVLQDADETYPRTIWDIPERREQELAEWERYTWHCGPVVKGHYVSDGRRLSFVLDSVRQVGTPTNILFQMSDEWKRDTIASIVRHHAAEGLLPDPAELAQKQSRITALREEWGSHWAKEATRGAKRDVLFEDPDPYRFLLAQQEDDRARNPYIDAANADFLASYVGSGAIGWDDGDEVDPSVYWDTDELSPLTQVER